MFLTNDDLPDGCLGCLLDMRQKGQLNDDDLHDLIAVQQTPLMQTTPCPTCKGDAYISNFQPDCAHCATCGVYLILDDGAWKPFRQGVSIQRMEGPPMA
jgi:hypothetical protein